MAGGFFTDTESFTGGVQPSPSVAPDTQPAEQSPGGLFIDNIGVTEGAMPDTEIPANQNQAQSPGGFFADSIGVTPVSYTHLTLPTILRV